MPSARASEGYVNPTVGSALVYQIAGMDRARVEPGVVYTGQRPDALEMDVYLPEEAASDRPPAILIGGPPAFGAGKDSGQKVGWSQLVAASGLAAIAFDIRSDQFLRTPAEPTADVAEAIAYLREHGRDLGIDPDRIGTLGFSFGTAPWHLAATMADPQAFVRCNVVFYGPLDLHDAGVAMDPELAGEYSATTFLRVHGATIAPMFIAKAGLDSADLNRSIDDFMTEGTRVGADVRLEVHQEGQHGFDLRDDDERSRQVMRDALDFMVNCLS